MSIMIEENYIFEALAKRDYLKTFSSEELYSAVSVLCKSDIDFMKNNNVLQDDSFTGEEYDDDDAFEYLSEILLPLFPSKKEIAIFALVDDYMEVQEIYFEDKGLLFWE